MFPFTLRGIFFYSRMTDIVSYIELFYDRGHHQEFLSLSQELAAPGELRQAQTFDFMFKNVEKQYESYLGINVKLRCVTLYATDSASRHVSVPGTLFA
jgi:hypothetical protein